MKTLSILLLSLVPIIPLFTMDAPYLTDEKFLLWCCGLTCTEVKREQVTGITPRQFLGIDEATINKDRFYLQEDEIFDDHITSSPAETQYNDPTDSDCCDRRIIVNGAGRWRNLEWSLKQIESHQPIKDSASIIRPDSFGRQHLDQFMRCSCYCAERAKGIPFKLYPNSIPYKNNCYLHAGICADPSEHIWVTTDPYTLSFENDNAKTTFPVQILWINPFKEPIKLHEFLLPGKTCFDVHESIAIKFINAATFQIYYNRSGRTYEMDDIPPATDNNKTTITLLKPIEDCERREQPSLWVITYTLDRIKRLAHTIDPQLLQKWYSAYYVQCATGSLAQETLSTLAQEMYTVLENH